MKKCNKCDETGHIRTYENGGISGRSCDCGYYQYLMKKRFENVSIEDLFAYASRRISDKKEGKSLVGGLLGSIKSAKKSASSKKNGKLGGRPKKNNNNQDAQ